MQSWTFLRFSRQFLNHHLIYIVLSGGIVTALISLSLWRGLNLLFIQLLLFQLNLHAHYQVSEKIILLHTNTYLQTKKKLVAILICTICDGNKPLKIRIEDFVSRE